MNIIPIQPTNGHLYPSQQAAHDDLMRCAAEVIREIRARGGKLPSVAKMAKDIERLWQREWQHLAPMKGAASSRL